MGRTRGRPRGVEALDDDLVGELPVRIGAPVDDAFAAGLPVRELRRTDRAEQLALVSGRAAWEHAGVPDVDPTRLAVAVGSANAGIASTIAQSRILDEEGVRHVSPHTVTMLMANGPAAWLSIVLGAKAGAHTPISACAAGVEAIAMGRDMIRAGRADVVVCGGVEAALLPFSLAAFGQSRALSTRNDEPGRASRPFDVDRDGFVMGEGAALLVLESEEHAAARGAVTYGEVSGTAVTSDAFDIVGGDPENQARTITLALRDAGLTPGDIGFVHAHATSTPRGDRNEAWALRSALTDPRPSRRRRGRRVTCSEPPARSEFWSRCSRCATGQSRRR
ncbi:hypothetical protein GCM10025864_16130 [Luteimicrobium album]|uniref:Ketosynthase family 3 (KS3) domain-containing protein n=1 Tax=Luteimicrobium album TaxID=1054550 RepID=A0ABQ6I230_9MICO|nr:hypothetical protein GCM10025864_16130 [Luteimicrobium album]